MPSNVYLSKFSLLFPGKKVPGAQRWKKVNQNANNQFQIMNDEAVQNVWLSILSSGSDENNGLIILWECIKDEPAPQQQWFFEGNGQLVNVGSKKCLTANPGNPVYLFSPTNDAAQMVQQDCQKKNWVSE